MRIDESIHKNVFDVVLASSNYIREKEGMGKVNRDQKK